MHAKFDEDTVNGLISIVFTIKVWCDIQTDTVGCITIYPLYNIVSEDNKYYSF